MTPESYIEAQPTERKTALRDIRNTILGNLPEGFSEVMQYGMITYVVPHRLYPAGYHVNPKDPLPFMSLGNQKGYIALYHLGIYGHLELRQWFEKTYAALDIGKLDMGKSCIRFKNMGKIPLGLIGELCRKMSVEAFVQGYLDNLNDSGRGKKEEASVEKASPHLESNTAPQDDPQNIQHSFPRSIGQPATRALLSAGYTRPEELTQTTEKALLALHGVGPKAVRILREVLAEMGLGPGTG